MNEENIRAYILDKEKEERLWESSVFVFDSSALLDFYFLPKKTREKIYGEVFSNMVSRLWLPSHVEYEFLKNRTRTIPKPVKEKYAPLKEKITTIRTALLKDIQRPIDDISRETIKDDKHPHIEQGELEKIKVHIDAFEKEIKSFEENIFKQIIAAVKEILDVEADDDVLKALTAHFIVGKEFSFDEILEITKEGKHRYEFKIPPGYGDLYKNEKKGTQIFGDLIIWKQMLEFAKEKAKPIIFITNDVTKDDDWCYKDAKATEPRISSPREELIKEIKDHAGVEFWMYNLPQFLYNANKYLKAEFSEQSIQNAYQHLNTKDKKGHRLLFKCNNCGTLNEYDKSDLELDFECIGTDKRNMGDQNHYEAAETFTCSGCDSKITATFEVWEYPVGVHNSDELTLKGAELLEQFFFTIDFFEDEYELDQITCEICSGNRDEMGNIVNLWDELELENEYGAGEKSGKYGKVVSGNCDWCNTLHIRCPHCGSVSAFTEDTFNSHKECEGGCGLVFQADVSYDHDRVEDFSLRLVDHRKEECQSCGKEFVNMGSMDMCAECEEKYGTD